MEGEVHKPVRSAEEREALRNIIAQWNANRLDLFELSEPNEDLEFHGVMRFYFQDAGQKVATKCIRVSSTATAQVAIETLIEKFRPDMRMLSIPEYALYEIHENGEDRKLEEVEKPLLVQLNWHKDDRDGRFLLRRMDEKSFVTHQSLDDGTHFKRKLSKREKKEKKKREKLQKPKAVAAQVAIVEDEVDGKDGIAEKLYSEMPETSFTRSISNPEAVMRRRRQQKLEKKLQQFRSTDGGPDTGGTLKIYGESLCRDVPYKTLLLSIKDNAAFVVKEMLEKYGLDKDEPQCFCLVQVLVSHDRENVDLNNGGSQKEFILDDDDCPLAILMNHHPAKGSIMFHIRRKPNDYQPRKRKKKPKSKGELDGSYPYIEAVEKLPFLLELNPDGSEITSGSPKKYTLHLNVTEVGSERGMSPSGQCLQLFGPNIQPRHCVIAHTEGIVTVTPCSRDAETYVNGQRIYETTILQHGMVVRFGRIHCFRFYNLGIDDRRLGPDGIRHPHEISYDRHSSKDDTSLHHSFDGDGNADAISNSNLKDYRRVEAANNKPNNLNRRGPDPILPAVLELWENNEDVFLTDIINNLDTGSVQFKLAPTYTLYMAARFQASTHFHPEITPNERAHRLTASLSNVASKIQIVVQERYLEAGSLAFWMANSSELLHFLKQDRHLSPFCVDAQDILAECVQVAFRNLAHCLQDELLNAMPKFLEDKDDLNEEEGASRDVLSVLVATMALLRRCRVNAALTIQLFSQIFHFINMWLFNKIVCEPRALFGTRLWGVRLKCRLSRVEMWAEKQGLELAADCHLSRILQAAHLLQAPKSSPDDLAAISSMCFKLNSLQLRALLERYQPAHDEPHIPHVLIENVVKVAENTADEMARSDGRDVRLEENPDLQLPFLLPEDGYSCDIVRGVPAGLQEFITPYQLAGLCRMAIQPSSLGYWTIYMIDHDSSRITNAPRSPSVTSYRGEKIEQPRSPKSSSEPEVVTIKLQKSNNGMGLSIVAARGVGQDKLGIYIKSVVKGGAADADGRLQAGDQLLKVDGQSLVGISQEKAAEYMTRTGAVVILEVGKQGAMYHGLATLLSQPSPVIHRSGPGYSGLRRMSERDIHGRVMKEQTNNSVDSPPVIMPRMQSSKSVPALNSGNNVPQEPIWNTNNHSNVYNGVNQPNSTDLNGSLKNRSANNLRPDGFHNNSQVPTISVQPPAKMYNGVEANQKGRPLSHPSYSQDEERHYQNIGVYLQGNQHSPSPQSQNYSGQIQEHQTPPIKPGFTPSEDRMSQRFRASQGALNRPEMQQQLNSLPQRPVSALLSQWEREHLSAPVAHQNVAGGNRTQDDSNIRNPQVAAQPTKYPSKLALNQNSYVKENQDQARNPNLIARGISSQELNKSSDRIRQDLESWRNERDVLRQEAKMEEMREEVKRREDRLARDRAGQTQKVGPAVVQYPHPGQNPAMQNNMVVDRAPRVPPPTQPKPRLPVSNNQYPGQMPNTRIFNQQDMVPDRPPLPAEELMMHRLESPQPPPPPPSSTHPLYQQQMQQNNTYRQRLGEMTASRSVEHFDRLPQGLSYDAQGNRIEHMSNSRSYPNELAQSTVSPSPWDREERERERIRRLDEARRLRDQEIEELEKLGPQRTPKEEERLRTLRLEQEFQRRAEELKNEEDDENDDEDDSIDRRGLLRLVQEDLERNRLKRMERENEKIQYQQKPIQPSQQQQQQQQANMDSQRQDRRLQFVEPEKTWRKDGVQQSQSAMPPAQMASGHLQSQQHFQSPPVPHQNVPPTQQQQPPLPNNMNPTRSEEWLRRQQEVKEQRQRLQYMEHQIQQPATRIITQERPTRLEEVNQIREQKREQERAALRELQVAREAEERLLREAQIRQEADMRRERIMQQQQQQQQQQQYQQQMQYNQQTTYSHYEPYSPPMTYSNQIIQDTNNNKAGNGYRPPHPKSENVGPPKHDINAKYQNDYNPNNYQMNDVDKRAYIHQQQQQQQAMNGSMAEPPERKDSYDKVASHYGGDGGSGYWDAAASPSAKENAPPPKRVSFHDSKEENGGNDSTSSNSSTMFSSPNNTQQITTFTTGSTPGVIGAQEVYRDPRQRIEASRNPASNASRGPGPEQLSFREKMKKFALETGENMTPKDKVKTSKAQREIETNLHGP